jgi:SPP1 family predicted phage head-tail adaptor
MSPRQPLTGYACTEPMTWLRDVATSDSQGGVTTTETNSGTVWFQLAPVSGFEVLRAGALEVTALHRGVTRYQDAFALADRFERERDGQVFEVAAIREIERHRWVEMDLIARHA